MKNADKTTTVTVTTKTTGDDSPDSLSHQEALDFLAEQLNNIQTSNSFHVQTPPPSPAVNKLDLDFSSATNDINVPWDLNGSGKTINYTLNRRLTILLKYSIEILPCMYSSMARTPA